MKADDAFPDWRDAAQLVVPEGFFSLAPKAFGAATVRGGERSKRTLGVIQTGHFHLSDRHGAQVLGKGLCCCVSISKTSTRLAGFPASRRPEWGGYHSDQQTSSRCAVGTPWKPVVLGKSLQLHPLRHCHLQLLRL